MRKLSRTLLMMLVLTLCTGLTSCEWMFSDIDNPAPTPTPESQPTSTTIELTTEELTPEQKGETEALLTAAQQKGATIGIKFSYNGVDYDASFEKPDGEDYKLTAFTSSQTTTIEETIKLAAFTPYLTLLIPDDWTEEQIDDYLDSISNEDDEGNENEVDEESDVDESGDEGDDNESDIDEGNADEGDDDEGDEDDSEYTDKLIFTDVDTEDEEPASARQMTRATATSSALDILFGLRTANDEDLVQVQINTAEATATIVGETDQFTIKGITTNEASYATARTRAAYKNSLTIKVNKKGSKQVSSVTLSPSTLKFTKSTAQTITAKVSPKEAKIKKIAWKSGNFKIAKIAQKGKLSINVKPGESGSTTITTKIGKKNRKCKVNVKIVESIKFDKKKLELTIDEIAKLNVTVTPKNVSQAVTWSSSKPTVAKVDKNGKVTALKAGTATITATSKANKEKKATCTVTVKKKAGSIKFTTTSYEKITTDAAFTNTTLEVVGDGKVTYESDKESVAKVDANTGEVTITGVGEATITATVTDGANYTYATKTATFKVTVKAATIAVTGVKLNKNSLELTVDGTEKLTATVNPTDATNKAVTWKSSNVSVATVDANGKVTAVAAGKATITVTTTDGSFSAECKVTVDGSTTVNPGGGYAEGGEI